MFLCLIIIILLEYDFIKFQFLRSSVRFSFITAYFQNVITNLKLNFYLILNFILILVGSMNYSDKYRYFIFKE